MFQIGVGWGRQVALPIQWHGILGFDKTLWETVRGFLSKDINNYQEASIL